jgi:hypothetical protein
MSLENALREALRREDAPPGFAARVSAAAEKRQRARWPLAAIAAALLCAALVPAGVAEYHRRRAIEAEDQLRQALSITRTQLQQVREKLQKNTRNLL